MSGVYGQLNQTFQAIWVSNSGAVGRGTNLSKLGPEQIAIFPADEYCGDGELVSLASPNFKKNKRLVIKQGLKPFAGQMNPFSSRKTKHARSSVEFEATDIVSFKGQKADLTPTRGEIVALGYDGLDTSKSLNNLKMDAKPIYISIRLSGAPIQRFFHRNYIDQRIAIDKGLCVGDCECFDACGKVNCDVIADGIVKYFETQDLLSDSGPKGQMLRVPLRQFVKASKIKKCTTPAVAPVKTEWKKYSISICDDGNTTIGKLYAKYPNKSITLESRVESTSVYSMWLPATEAAPDDFVLGKHVQPICDVCPTCPETYTAVPGVKIVQERVACGGTPIALPGEIDSALVSSTLRGGDVYIKTTALTTTDEAIETALVGCLEYSIIGEEGKSCVGEEVTFSWKSCENCFKTTKQYKIVLPDADCAKGTSRLEELQDAYPNLVIEDEAAGSCLHSYKTTVDSDCVSELDCDRLVDYQFKAPASYEGVQWTEYLAPTPTTVSCEPGTEVEAPCCACGVIFETAYWDQNIDACTFGWSNWDPNNSKPVRLQVSLWQLDYTDNPCNITEANSTILQRLHINAGVSGEALQAWEKNFLTYENSYFSLNPYSNAINGFNIVAKSTEMYDSYTLRIKRKQYGESHFLKNQDHFDYIFYVPTGTGKDLEKLLNELVLSAGNPDLKAVIL